MTHYEGKWLIIFDREGKSTQNNNIFKMSEYRVMYFRGDTQAFLEASIACITDYKCDQICGDFVFAAFRAIMILTAL